MNKKVNFKLSRMIFVVISIIFLSTFIYSAALTWNYVSLVDIINANRTTASIL